ncbi:MAG: hypothetical protein KBT20_00835 [Bacteroidales bacterium]|nr:hypothetical protein [Candidatus Liminaster caballi]
MGTYTKASVKRPGGSPGAGLHPQDELIVIDCEDIATFPERDADGVNVTEAVVMGSGKKAVAIYMTPGTYSIESNSDGDPDQEGFQPQIQGSHPGNEEEIRKFKANWLGKRCICILRYCNGKKPDIFGTPCNPMRLQVAYSGSADSNMNQFTFQQTSKGEDIGIYLGAMPAIEGESAE